MYYKCQYFLYNFGHNLNYLTPQEKWELYSFVDGESTKLGKKKNQRQ